MILNHDIILGDLEVSGQYAFLVLTVVFIVFCGFICSLISVHHCFYSYRELLYRLCLFENIGWPMLCKDAEVWTLSIRIFKRSIYGLNLDLLSLFKQLPLNFWA